MSEPSWIRSDGVLEVDRLTVSVEPVPDCVRPLLCDNPEDYNSAQCWRIGLDYRDAWGDPAQSEFTLIGWPARMLLESVINTRGRLSFNFDSSFERTRNLRNSAENYLREWDRVWVLELMAHRLYHRVCALTGRDASALLELAGGESFNATFEGVRLALVPPSLINWQHPGQYLADRSPDQHYDMVHAVEISRPRPEPRPLPEYLLRERLEALNKRYAAGRPEHGRHLDELIAAGLPLGPMEYASRTTRYRVDGESYDYCQWGTTTLLYEAVAAGDAALACALLARGADPMFVIERSDEAGRMRRHSPFMAAVEEGHAMVVRQMLSTAPPDAALDMLARYDARYTRLSSKARKRAALWNTGLEELAPLFNALRARTALASFAAVESQAARGRQSGTPPHSPP